jgi:outer membrane protein assembly factor BamC
MRRRDWLLPVVAVVAGIALGACSSFRIETQKIDYKSAGKMAPLEIPPDLTRPSADDRYAVPDINPKGTATFSDYNRDRTGQRVVTGASPVLPKQDDIRIERDGTQRWLVAKGSPQQVWQTVKDFWQEIGFIVNVEVPEAGVMETDWAENRAQINDGAIRSFLSKMLDTLYSTGERDKFRTRLENGSQPGTTEIYISHRGMEEVYTNQAGSGAGDTKGTAWQPRKPDPDLELMMLGRLMLRLGAEETRVKTQVAAGGGAPGRPRATLSRGGADGGTLALEDQFDRAWRRVGLALDRVGFTVEDRDRSKGLYFVRYIDPQIDNKSADKGSSWFSRLKFWGSGDKPAPTAQYRIEVKDASQGSQVKVLNKDGAQEASDTASRILTLLYDQLK